MGIYGKNQTQTLYPGQTKRMLGVVAIPGTPITKANETLAASQASSVVVVASQPGYHPSTQRQITWRIFGDVAGLDLQASVDDVDANYISIDTSAGTSGTEVRVVQADNSAADGPGLQSALKIVSSARFFRVLNTNGSPITGAVDITCQ
jgi:hypothetical protein